MKPAERLKAYLERKRKAIGLDLDLIHCFDGGEIVGGLDCRASDVEAVLSALAECERALARVADVFLDVDGKHGPQESDALEAVDATLEKLRG